MNWNDLSIKQKSDVMRVAINNGITDINDIKAKYNEFAEGGDTREDRILSRVNSSNADFVQRLKDPDRQYIEDWEHPGSGVATHKLGVAQDEKGTTYIYPKVIRGDSGKLVDFSRPPYRSDLGEQIAIDRKDTVNMPSLEDAIWFTDNYKKFYPQGESFSPYVKSFAEGGNLYGDGGDKATENYSKQMSEYITSLKKQYQDLFTERGIEYNPKVSGYDQMRDYYGKDYEIPYDPKNRVNLTVGRFNTGYTSTDVLDAIADAAENVGLPLETALGIAGKESNLGYGYKQLKSGNNPNKIKLVSAWNTLGLSPQPSSKRDAIINIAKKYNNKENISKEEYEAYKKYYDYEYNQTVNMHAPKVDPLEYIFTRFRDGYNGNPGDPHNRERAYRLGNQLINDPAVRKYYLKTGRIAERIPFDLSEVSTPTSGLFATPPALTAKDMLENGVGYNPFNINNQSNSSYRNGGRLFANGYGLWNYPTNNSQ